MSKRYSKVQEFYDLARLYNHYFNIDREVADNAYRAKVELFRKMSAVEREQVVRNAANVTRELPQADFKKLITGRA